MKDKLLQNRQYRGDKRRREKKERCASCSKLFPFRLCPFRLKLCLPFIFSAQVYQPRQSFALLLASTFSPLRSFIVLPYLTLLHSLLFHTRTFTRTTMPFLLLCFSFSILPAALTDTFMRSAHLFRTKSTATLPRGCHLPSHQHNEISRSHAGRHVGTNLRPFLHKTGCCHRRERGTVSDMSLNR